MTNLDIFIILFMLGALLLLSLGAFIEDRCPHISNRSKRYIHPPKRKASRKGVKK